ncbi:MAG TPA: amidohydrolase family protein, partial [Caulobacteraceae bacterium]|nr:amidohydrolase family protein [Caulobacteraceae bacterium]
MSETILEPELPIIDPHHHLWDRRPVLAAVQAAAGPEHPFTAVVRKSPVYLLDELLEDTGSGHNIRATVFIECRSMYRADGPVELRPVGETEFVNGVAAMSASGLYGEMRACAGIVGHADMMLGESVQPVLEAHIAAGSGRFRGIRHSVSHDPDTDVLGPLALRAPGLYREAAFQKGVAQLAKNNLSFEAWLLEPQLPQLIALVNACPETQVVLDHVGTPLGIASYEGRRDERFPIWAANIRELARAPNVTVKLGGLAMSFCNFPSFLSEPAAPSHQLAKEWGPYLDTCVEAFGADRCMFESNFPVDLGSCSYATLWNAFKVFAAGASSDEKRTLFAATAKRIYRLDDIVI